MKERGKEEIKGKDIESWGFAIEENVLWYEMRRPVEIVLKYLRFPD
jgi:hypothetical protein